MRTSTREEHHRASKAENAARVSMCLAALGGVLGISGCDGVNVDPTLAAKFGQQIHSSDDKHQDKHRCPTPPAGVRGTFRPTSGSMVQPRSNHADVLLADGDVLLVGGRAPGTGAPLASAEIYDPTCDVFVAVGPMRLARAGLRATRLEDGRVLVTGGVADDATTELYDPRRRMFSDGPPMSTPRLDHTATLLSSGRVLVAGGQPPSSGDASAELYDPASSTFIATGSMTVTRRGHEAIRLRDGRVLITGGPDPRSSAGSGRTEAELYLPDSGTFVATGSLAFGRNTHRLTLLEDGRVLVSGGVLGGIQAIAELETYDPAAGEFSPAGTLQQGRVGHVAALLPKGRVLIAGGNAAGGTTNSAELYKPKRQTSTLLAATMNAPRLGHSGTVLKDGKVLIAGGVPTDAPAGTPSAEVFTPKGLPSHAHRDCDDR